MLRTLYVFQTSGLPLYKWENPRLKSTDQRSIPSLQQITSLMSALLMFSQQTLQHEVEWMGLDDGGFLSVTAERDVVFVGIFSKGDSRWRAQHLLKSIRRKFISMFGDQTLAPMVILEHFKKFDDEFSNLLKFTKHRRDAKTFLFISSVTTIITTLLLVAFKLTLALVEDLLSLFTKELSLYSVGYLLFLCFMLQFIVDGSFSFKLAAFVGFAQLMISDATFLILWALTPLFFVDILDAAISTAFLLGYLFERLLFLQANP